MLGFPHRVDLTGEAADLLRRLTGLHGPLMFHQSGGCCDGSSPMCYPDGDFITSDADVHLGDLPVDGLAGAGAVLDVDVAVRLLAAHAPDRRRRPGPGSGFSLEAPEGVRFLIRSRLLTDDELSAFGITSPRV